MSVIVNDRDKLLQAAAVRFVLPTIDPIQIPGLPGAFDDIEQLQNDVEDLGEQIDHLMNTSASFFIRAPALAFFGAAGTTTPSSITLTAERGSGLVGGTIAWTVFAGSATISPSSGDSTAVIGSTVTGRSVTIRARLTIDLVSYDAYATITRFGAVSAVDQVSLTTQVTGQLANSNVTGLGALALLNTVSLNSQVTGALNGLTQVTNLGNLAFANGLAANQIGAGTLAAGVIYAGAINANNITAGTITGRTLQTSATYPRVVIDSASNQISILTGPSLTATYLNAFNSVFTNDGGISPTVHIIKSGSSAPALQVTGSTTGAGLIVRLPGGGSTSAPFRLDPSISLPSSRIAGSICFHGGWLCFANGSHWFNADGTQLT
ncbi:hypothetical protein H0A65_10880 [Alcaligenaceae bacterium]|nr:hypothetical protein [Alcaligenaceae bacterium]